MLNRRDWLKIGAIGAGAGAARGLRAAVRSRPLGVQLYTVRNEAERDLPGTLRQIREIGYEQVETYWNVYTHPARELRKMITDAGLRVPSGHFDYEGFAGKFDYAQQLGVRYMTCPMLPKSMWTSADDFKRAAGQFNAWGEEARRGGMRFAFHNHNYEFRRFGNTTGFDTLIANTDPRLVWLEMDCYWIVQAGQDPVQTMTRLGRRVRMLHLKDRKPGFPPSQELNDAAGHFTEVGNGTLDWKAILAAADRLGIEYEFVEQDFCDRPPIESLRISYRNLRRITAAP